tara:strand:+ start:324 stop:644 length:321 start_codon:yes stop_codon:yes gene_type:complete
MNEGDMGGNDGDDGPRTPKKAKCGTKGSRKTGNQRSVTKRAGSGGLLPCLPVKRATHSGRRKARRAPSPNPAEDDELCAMFEASFGRMIALIRIKGATGDTTTRTD